MKKLALNVLVGVALCGALITVGCEWSSGGSGNSFNTSRGAGIQINFSGTYNGNYPDGKAVQGSSIIRIVINQSGNLVEAYDNNNSSYQGSIGSPGAVTPDSTTISAGATLAQAQINFKGHNNATDRDVEFVGTIHAVAITDIQGDTKIRETIDSSYSYLNTNAVSGSQTNYTITTVSGGGSTTIEISTDNPSGETVTDIKTYEEGSGVATIEETTFLISEANTQYRLEGNWIEIGGVHAGVDALSRGSSGLLSIVDAGGAQEDSGLEEGTFGSGGDAPEINLESGN